MGHDWILNVLTDLKTYAEQNGLGTLAGQLGDTTLVAQAEISSQSPSGGRMANGDRADIGQISREARFG